MYYYGNSYGYGYPSSCCGMGGYPSYGYGGYGSNYAIILVLFILLVIIIGSRVTNR